MRSCYDHFDLLSCAFVYGLFLFCPLLWQRTVLLVISLWLRRKQYCTQLVIMIMFLSFLFLSQPKEVLMPSSSYISVSSIYPSYVIGDTGKEKVVIYGLENVSFEDIIYLKGDWETIQSNENFNQFSFKEYLAARAIYFCMQPKDYYVIKKGESLQSRLYRSIQEQKDSHKELLNSMLFGISEQDSSYFLRASGLHIATLAYFIRKWLSRRLSNGTANGITCLFLILMGTCFGYFDSLFRVLCFRISSLFFKKKGDQIGASIFLILSVRGYLVRELTFVLPLAFRLINYFFNSRRNRRRKFHAFPILVLFQLCYFHEVEWLQTIFFRPFRIIYCLLYVCMFFGMIHQESIPFAVTVSKYIGEYAKLLSLLVYHYAPSFFWIIAWLIVSYFWLVGARRKYLLIMIVLLGIGKIEPYFDPFFEITVIDVGQGDCALIVMPHHQGVVMIDIAGSLYKNIPESIVGPILKDKQIQTIDVLIITHDDYDHSGGYEELEEIVNIKTVITAKENVKDPFLIYSLLAQYQGSDANENSLINWFGRDNIFYLFMGDAGIEAEQTLLEAYDGLPCDILKLGHHGSDSSSSLSFLHEMHPQYALISVGENNRYGHPSASVLDSLERERIPYFSTAENGAICIRSTQLFKYMITARGDFVIIEDR